MSVFRSGSSSTEAPRRKSATGDRKRVRLGFLLPGLIVVLAAIVQRARDGGLGEHFGGGQLGMNNGAYTARIATNIARIGIVEARFGAPFIVIPSQPSTIEHNLRHPSSYFVIYGLLCQAFGIRPIVIHVSAIVVYVFGVVLVCALVANILEAKHAAAAGAFMAGVPLGSHYGFMSASSLPSTLFAALALLSYFKWHREMGPSDVTQRRKWIIVSLISFSIACQLDWWGYCLVPAVIVDQLLFARSRRLRTMGLLVLVVLANVVLTTLHVSYVLGGFQAGVDQILSLGSEAVDVHVRVTPLELRWYAGVFTHFIRELTWLGAIVVIVGIVVGMVSGGSRMLLALFIFGMANQLMLPWYAHTHDYWMLYFWPFFGMSAGYAVSRVRGWCWIPAWLCMAGICLYGIAISSREFDAERWMHIPTSPDAIGAAINTVSESNDMVFVPVPTTLLPMHVDPIFCYGPVRKLDELAMAIQRFCRTPISGRILYVSHKDQVPVELRKMLDDRKTPKDVRGIMVAYDLTVR